MMDEEAKKVLEENRDILQDLDKRIHRIERKFIWNTIFGFIKAVVILAPLIVGVIYLTPILKDYVKIFEPIFKSLPATLQNLSNPTEFNSQVIGSNQVDPMLESFCDPQTREIIIKQFCK